MNSKHYQTELIVSILQKQKIATMDELKAALGTKADLTVFRKLKELSYRTSYSHRGRFYTLDDIARFDENGLWAFESVWFSRFGTLIATAESFVRNSEAGYFVAELENRLHIGVKEPLLKLVRQKRLHREKIFGRYLYCSSQPVIRRKQLGMRHLLQDETITPGDLEVRVVPDELQAAIILFFSLLDEKQRRLYAGLESAKLGHGGDSRMARLLNLDPATVAKGRKQLFTQDVEIERVRALGGGRPSTEKKRLKSSNESGNS